MTASRNSERKFESKLKQNVFIVSAFFLILAGISFACIENKENVRKAYSIKEGKSDIAENEFVTMHVFPEDVFVNSLIKIKIENHSKRNLFYSQNFSLDYFDKENWKQIQIDINFEDIGYVLKANEKIEEQFYVSKKYFHRLGRYRIVKNLGLHSNLSLEIDSGFNLYAEFEVK